MKLPVSMPWRAWIILVLMALLAGCSALRLSYGQGPLLAYWWLDNYADFNADQSPRVKSALADWFAWHRATQLGDYARGLSEMQAMVVNPVTAAQVCTLFGAWQRRAERAFEHAVPALADQLRTLTSEQIAHIERRQREQMEALTAEYLEPDVAERRKTMLERSVDRAESLYGTLDDAQRRQLASALAASPFDPQLWLAERRRRQVALVQRLRQWQSERTGTDTVQAGLRMLAAHTVQSPQPEYAAYAARLTQANCALAAQLHNSTSAAQRKHAVDKLKGWEEDLQALRAS